MGGLAFSNLRMILKEGIVSNTDDPESGKDGEAAQRPTSFLGFVGFL
jgi:hypothetical protein